MNRKWFFFLSIFAILFYYSCEHEYKESPVSDEMNLSETDSLGFEFVYSVVLSEKCAIPACHDGSFEPDFSTIFSAYSTTVFHPVIKNNRAHSFEYRVKPFKKEESVLWERITNCCFMNEKDQMPQNDLGNSLPEKDIELIGQWIDDGAKDVFGNYHDEPLKLYSFAHELIARDVSGNVIYSDSLARPGISSIQPMEIPDTAILNFEVVFYDRDQIGLNDITGSFEFSKGKWDSEVVETRLATLNDGSWITRVDMKSLSTNSTFYINFKLFNTEGDLLYEYPGKSSPKYIRNNWSFNILNTNY